MMHSQWFFLLAAAALLPVLHGCGSSSTATLSGNVTFDGQPVANGSLTLTPADGKGPMTGGPIAEGRYRIDNITPGRKIVQIVGLKKINFAKSHEEMAQAAKDAARQGDKTGIVERADEIPPDAEGNNATVDVQPGQTESNFALKRPAPAEKKAN